MRAIGGGSLATVGRVSELESQRDPQPVDEEAAAHEVSGAPVEAAEPAETEPLVTASAADRDYAMVPTITASDREPATPAAGVETVAAEPSAARDLGLGQKTAEGLATMTPVARQTAAVEREFGEVALRLDGLTKRFGSHLAVENVSYEVRQGSFSGIVGPNGAGKTTTLMMISGLLPPTRGTVHVGGTDVWREPRVAHRKIGTLPDRLRMFDQLTGAQYLGYVGTLRGLRREKVLERTEALLDQFELRASANRLVVDYSAGMRKKLALAATLIHAPEVLILDEPFETIDPVSAGVLIDVLLDYADRGGTVVLSSHSMDLVQRVCDHVAVIVEGEVIAEGTVDEVRDGITLEERFRHIVRGPVPATGLDWLEISFG